MPFGDKLFYLLLCDFVSKSCFNKGSDHKDSTETEVSENNQPMVDVENLRDFNVTKTFCKKKESFDSPYSEH